MKQRTWVVAVMLFVILRAMSGNTAQAQSNALTLTIGRVTAVLDTFSGRFAAASAEGSTLLFSSGTRPTSHISVLIDNAIWTNYGKSQMTAPWPQRNLGRGTVELRPDRLRYIWEVPNRGSIVRIIEEIEPVSDSLYQEVRIHLIVENTTSRIVNVGMTVMEDVDANGDDNVTLQSLTGPVLRERAFAGAYVPERLMMLSPAFLPDSAYCRFRGAGVSTPDLLTVGRWSYHGGLGTAVFGYQATGQSITDAALLLQWEKKALAPGTRREENTAIGFAAPLPEAPGYKTFAREFVVPMLANAALLSIVSDSVATVRISAPYADAWYENAAMRNGSWDTTMVVTPDNPACALIQLAVTSRTATDSLTHYRQYFVKASSDREAAISLRSIVGFGSFNASIVWPLSEWDTSYLLPGVLDDGVGNAQDAGAVNRIVLHQTIEYWLDEYYNNNQGVFPIGTPFQLMLPAHGHLDFAGGGGGFPRFNPWSPKLGDRNLTFDGAGDPLTSEHPVSMEMMTLSKISPGQGSRFLKIYPILEPHYFHIPARKQLGTEYVFIPFRKLSARTQDDLIRIIAYEDETELTLFDGSLPIHLDRSGYIDTLLAQPTVIRSTKPVVIYQHHLAWTYLDSDTTFAGAAFALLPHGLWGRRYYSVTDDGFKPNVMPLLPSGFRNHALYYDNLYFILITKAVYRNGILINDVPVDEARFTVFGEWAYAYIDILPGFHIVRSDHPFLTVSCGGGGGDDGKKHFGFGVSFIPPFR
ncbi:MAG: hypothetical protein WBQ23_03655 [Bacteroidota bacterium]